MRLLSPVHIGSGLFELVDGQVVRAFIKRDGQWIIPGSSLKGVFRSIAEAISASCISKTRASYRELPWKELEECDDPDQLCVCCRIFGSLRYVGRVRFTDALPFEQTPTIVSVPALFRPRSEARIYKDSRGRYRGRKFYFHGKLSPGREPLQAITARSTFGFRTDFEDLTDAELCLLLTAMGVLGGLKPKLGGGKPACLGSIEVNVQRVSLREPSTRFLDFTGTSRPFTKDEWNQIQSASSLVRNDALAKLSTILVYSLSRNCPSGSY
jgi:hypothetical protein